MWELIAMLDCCTFADILLMKLLGALLKIPQSHSKSAGLKEFPGPLLKNSFPRVMKKNEKKVKKN